MSTPYARGRATEYAACNVLARMGFSAQRTAGSHSPFDIVATSVHGVWLIQVKAVRDEKHIPAAQRHAREAWQGFTFPQIPHVYREVWVRCKGKWFRQDLDQYQEATK